MRGRPGNVGRLRPGDGSRRIRCGDHRPYTTPYVQRTAITEPLEVYRPRSVPVSYPSERDVRRPVRTKTKSAVIIGSSTAIGATIGGLTKGTKGAIIGGIVGGGAATVWDQVTRRRTDGR